ncbi:hypothetical protein KNP414_04682 [Paenibacillus mucilaginosus KNP414]|uniref:Uncharacterized protein n=1 Tax=Paenibacillus mucilaginosus (strain KNP414) TaxID=1036673 RepID=F8FE12_PAEMK|nr:hypothetical protein KNP414_04682 [Paenibacillus mucilaginosus KNP414]
MIHPKNTHFYMRNVGFLRLPLPRQDDTLDLPAIVLFSKTNKQRMAVFNLF